MRKLLRNICGVFAGLFLVCGVAVLILSAHTYDATLTDVDGPFIKTMTIFAVAALFARASLTSPGE